MRQTDLNEDAEVLLVISGNAEFIARLESEFGRRRKRLCMIAVNGVSAARQLLEVRSPTVILLEDSSLAYHPDSLHEPSLWAAVTSLAESAPVVVIGNSQHRSDLNALLASGAADYVTRSASSFSAAVDLIEGRLRQKLLNSRLSVHLHGKSSPSIARDNLAEPRDFGEVLRHELNNPLTGILGNAELLLVELRRKNIELPSTVETRLETIATLAVRMRETVRRLSEEWESRSEKISPELVERQH